MSTLLQQQLNKLASGHRQERRLRKTASFLFSDEVAQEISLQQYHKIGVKGLKGLAHHDSRFNHFFTTLFDEASLETERNLLTGEDAEMVDKELTRFLYLVSPHFLLSCAHEALEYLLRHYQVHIILPLELLRTIIPYHEHIFFARMVQLIPLRTTAWKFLNEIQKRGATLTRAVLAQHCIDDPGILTQVCTWCSTTSEYDAEFPTMMNLVVGLTAEIVTTTVSTGKSIGTWLMSSTLKLSEKLLHRGKTIDGQAAGVALVAVLFSTNRMAPSVCAKVLSVITRLLKSSTREPMLTLVSSTMVLQLASLVTSQLPLSYRFTRKLPSYIYSTDWCHYAPVLQQMHTTVEGRKFITIVLVNGVLKGCKPEESNVAEFCRLMEKVKLSAEVVSHVARHCFSMVVEMGSESTIVATLLRDFLKALAANNSTGFDAAVHQELKARKGEAGEKILYEWLKEDFRGQKHQVITVGSEAFSLTMACMHPDEGVRRLAAGELIAALRHGANGDEQLDMLTHMIDIEESQEVLEVLLPDELPDLLPLANFLPVTESLSSHTFPKTSRCAIPAMRCAAMYLKRQSVPHQPRKKAKKSDHQPTADTSNFWDLAVRFSTMAHNCLVYGKNTGKKAVAAAVEALKGCASLEPLASALAEGEAKGLAGAVGGMVSREGGAALSVYLSHATQYSAKALDGRHRGAPNSAAECAVVHLVATLLETHDLPDAGPALVTAFVNSRELLKILYKIPFPAGTELETSNPTATALAPGQLDAGSRLKLLYLSLIERIATGAPLADLAEKEAQGVLIDCFVLLSLGAEDPLISDACNEHCEEVVAHGEDRSSGAFLSAMWLELSHQLGRVLIGTAESQAMEIAAVKALSMKKKKGGVAGYHALASLLCLLNVTGSEREPLQKSVVSALQGIVPHVPEAAQEFVRSLTAMKGILRTGSVAECIAQAISSSTDPASVISGVAGGALEWQMGDMGEALGEVVHVSKLRGFMASLGAVVGAQQRVDPLPSHHGKLLAAAIGSFAAIFKMLPSEFTEMADRATVHQLLCQCISHTTPLPILPEPMSSWAYRAADEASAAPVMVSIPNLVADVLLNDEDMPRDGVEETLRAFNVGEMQHFVNSLLTLVGSGQQVARRLVRGLAGVIAGGVKRVLVDRATERWGKDTLMNPSPVPTELAEMEEDSDEEGSPDMENGSPQSIRKIEGKEQSMGHVLELLILLHTGTEHLPGQNPVQTAAVAWRCLRAAIASAAGRKEMYEISLLLTLLANCAEEVSYLIKHREEGSPDPTVDNLIPHRSDKKGIAAPSHGLLLVDLDAYADVLKVLSTAHLRSEGLRLLRALIEIDPSRVYSTCLNFVVSAIGMAGTQDLLEDILKGLMPVLISSSKSRGLIGLVHVVLYSYASRRGDSESALDACHQLLFKCNVQYQLIALTRLIMLMVQSISEEQRPEEETKLLLDLKKFHPVTLPPEQIELRIVLFVLRHITNDGFLNAVLDEERASRMQLDEEEGAEEEEEEEEGQESFHNTFSDLFLCLLQLCREKAMDTDTDSQDEADVDDDSSDLSDGSGGMPMEENLYDLRVPLKTRIRQLLSAMVDAMPTAVFVTSIRELLTHSIARLRSLGLRLFNNKLTDMGSNMPEADAVTILTMLPDLRDALVQDLEGAADDAEGGLTLQTSLWMLEILAKHLAARHPKSFVHFLPQLTEICKKHTPGAQNASPTSCEVLSSTVLALGHIAHKVEDLALEHLPQAVSALIDVFTTAVAAAATAGLGKIAEEVRTLAISCCAAVKSLLLELNQYMVPYYNSIARLVTARGAVAAAEARASEILDILVSKAERRVLLPAITKTLSETSTDEHSHPMLWKAIATVVADTPVKEVLHTTEPVMRIIAHSYQVYTEMGLPQLEVLQAVGKAFTAVVLRLDEPRVVACLASIQQIALAYNRTSLTLVDLRRLLSFYVLVSSLQQALSSLFAPIYKSFLPQTLEVLGLLKDSKKGGLLASTTAVVVLHTLHELVENDDDMVIAKATELSQELATAVINQLPNKSLYEHELVYEDDTLVGTGRGYEGTVVATMRPILSRICLEAPDRMLWSKVHKQILKLLKMASDPECRRAILTTLKGIYEDVGEEFAAALTAELLQPLSEALDDDDFGVSKIAVDLTKLVSRLTGEDVAKYMKGER